MSWRWRWTICGKSEMVDLQSLGRHVWAKSCNFRLLRNFINECSVVNVELFRFEMKPVELTSKQFTVQSWPVISVTNGAYFRLFSMFLWSMFVVNGTVSSKMCSFFFAGSMMTISGLRFVKQSSAGMVPPPVAGLLLRIWLKQGKERILLARILEFLEKARKRLSRQNSTIKMQKCE